MLGPGSVNSGGSAMGRNVCPLGRRLRLVQAPHGDGASLAELEVAENIRPELPGMFVSNPLGRVGVPIANQRNDTVMLIEHPREVGIREFVASKWFNEGKMREPDPLAQQSIVRIPQVGIPASIGDRAMKRSICVTLAEGVPPRNGIPESVCQGKQSGNILLSASKRCPACGSALTKVEHFEKITDFAEVHWCHCGTAVGLKYDHVFRSQADERLPNRRAGKPEFSDERRFVYMPPGQPAHSQDAFTYAFENHLASRSLGAAA